MFTTELRNLGLSEKEALIYLALLKVEHASVLEISKKSEINRSTVYVVLSELIAKGLVSEVHVGRKIHYRSEPPERLETYVERQRLNLEDQSRKIKTLIPQLKSTKREPGEKPVVSFYDGREGIHSAIEEFYRQAGDADCVYYMYNDTVEKEFFTEKDLEHFRTLKRKYWATKKYIEYAIYNPETFDASNRYKEIDTDEKRITWQAIDGAKYPLPCDITIFKNTVRIIIFGKELSTVVIDSKDLATTMTSLFNIINDQSK